MQSLDIVSADDEEGDEPYYYSWGLKTLTNQYTYGIYTNDLYRNLSFAVCLNSSAELLS